MSEVNSGLLESSSGDMADIGDIGASNRPLSSRPPTRGSNFRAAFNMRRLVGRLFGIVVMLIVVFGIWEAVAVGAHLNKAVLPTPPEVATAMGQNFNLLMHQLVPTLIEALLGYAVAGLLGIPLGYLLALPSRLQSTLSSGVLGMQIFPKIAVAPLFVVWFGFGYGPKVLFVFLLGFFPIALNSGAGFASVPAEVRDLERILGLGRWARLTKIEVPWSLPNVFTGLKISASFAVIAAIVYEFVGSNDGLGFIILQSATNLDSTLMFCAFIVVTVLGFMFYGVIALAEMLMIPWHISRRNVK